MKKLLVLTLMVLVAGVTTPVLAAAPKTDRTEQAKAYIDKLGAEALSTIEASKSGKITDAQAKDKFRALLSQSFDTPTIARFTLGRYWRVATPAQQKEFTGLINDIIINKYADRILNASSGTYEITGASAINERDYAVAMKVKPVDDAPISFAWRVRDNKGSLKVIDLAVEGVSMSITHRSDYSSTIERNGGNVQGLIDALKAKLKK